MNRGIEVTEDIFWVGTNDLDTTLFENIWPLPRGVSYNAYLIRDDKTALIDSVKGMFVTGLIETIQQHLGPGRPLDYLIVNHMEPDHSGSILVLRRVFPNLKIIGNAKTAGFLADFYGVTENVQIVDDGDLLDLGRHKLRFYLTPMIHWPETMMTHDETTKVLFSGDAFGGFGALPGGIFDDEVDVAFFEDEALRYFSNIVGKFCNVVARTIERLSDLEISAVAATHGPVWRQKPHTIINQYQRWARQETEDGAVVVYGSMYGNSERMAQAVARGLAEEGVEKVRIHNVSRTHNSFIISDLWRFRAFAFGAPTYNVSLFPLMDDLMRLLANVRLTDRVAGIFGTYAWTGGGVKAIRAYCEKARYQLVDPVVEAKCSPTCDDLENCRLLGRNIAKALREGQD